MCTHSKSDYGVHTFDVSGKGKTVKTIMVCGETLVETAKGACQGKTYKVVNVLGFEERGGSAFAWAQDCQSYSGRATTELAGPQEVLIVHCKEGIARSGIMLAHLLVAMKVTNKKAIEMALKLSSGRFSTYYAGLKGELPGRTTTIDNMTD